jgi:hypothetical protein
VALLCAAASGCLAVPPSRAELAWIPHQAATGHRFAAGAHSASGGAGQHGSYLELGGRVWQRGSVRAFAAARGEVYWNRAGELGTTRAASARLSVEQVVGHVAAGGGGRDAGAAVYGLFAPGVFLEAGVRGVERGGISGTVIGGIYLRLPMVLAASKPTFW